jgi:hypothetical protein
VTKNEAVGLVSDKAAELLQGMPLDQLLNFSLAGEISAADRRRLEEAKERGYPAPADDAQLPVNRRSPNMAVTVYTTTGNTWTLANGASAATEQAATGELTADVYSAPAAGSGPDSWLGSFGSVEAVFLNGEAVLTPAAAPRGGL